MEDGVQPSVTFRDRPAASSPLVSDERGSDYRYYSSRLRCSSSWIPGVRLARCELSPTSYLLEPQTPPTSADRSDKQFGSRVTCAGDEPGTSCCVRNVVGMQQPRLHKSLQRHPRRDFRCRKPVRRLQKTAVIQNRWDGAEVAVWC